ncbi:MAG: O-methyltransferase [Candidatus Dormibacteraeota bacterium]|nr:O-methyltransferase [Candidatus Dormibacteraeota bacterium]
MDTEIWSEVDAYVNRLVVPSDRTLEAVLAATAAAGLPPIQVSPSQGRLLQILARLSGARAILEIGTLGAYSTIWMARALPSGGELVTLEADPRHAAVARANLVQAGLEGIVSVVEGRAQDTLAEIAASGRSPFDMVFIDADKTGYPEYFRWALRMTRAGSLIVADNVIRGGAVVDTTRSDADVQGVRGFLELIAAEPRVEATVIQTVGAKGYDGLALALVLPAP